MTPFLDLVTHDQLAPVLLGFERAVQQSFRDDKSRATGDEVRRRLAICERLFRALRGDLGWGLARVLDHLAEYLRRELDGIPWAPDERKVWVPADGPPETTPATPVRRRT